MARACPASQASSWWGGSDLHASSQVDGGDTESQRLSWEGWDPRGRGLRPTLPRWRSRASKQGQHAPHDCLSPQETGGGGRASWRTQQRALPWDASQHLGLAGHRENERSGGRPALCGLGWHCPAPTHLPSSCWAGPPDRLGDGGVQAQKHLWCPPAHTSANWKASPTNLYGAETPSG